MKKKTNMRTVIRKIVREEVAIAIQEVITELKQPIQQVSKPKPKKKTVEKKQYTKNSILNEVMNETANSDWEDLGGGTYTTDKMGDILAKEYNGISNGGGKVNADAMVASMGVDPNTVDDGLKDVFTKDYRSLMKKVDEKSKQKRGV